MSLKNVTILALGIVCGTTAAPAQTVSQVFGDTLTKQTQTVYAQAEADWTTYDSEAADSQVTTMTNGVTIGANAGEDRPVGFKVSYVNQDITFDQTNTDITNIWADLNVEMRIAFLYPSFGVSMSEMKIDTLEHKSMVYGKGVNAGLGMRMPLTRTIMVEADAKVVRMLDSDNLLNSTSTESVELKDRQEGDIRASFDIIDLYLDFLVGYKMRRFGVEITEGVETAKFEESQSAPYAGLRLGLYF